MISLDVVFYVCNKNGMCHFFWVVFSLSNSLYIEIQMPWKLQLSGKNLLVDAKRIIIKKWWIP